jgi:hypothetical protein
MISRLLGGTVGPSTGCRSTPTSVNRFPQRLPQAPTSPAIHKLNSARTQEPAKAQLVWPKCLEVVRRPWRDGWLTTH